jgi:hypothetical protein
MDAIPFAAEANTTGPQDPPTVFEEPPTTEEEHWLWNTAYNNIPTPKTSNRIKPQDLRPTPGIDIMQGIYKHRGTDNRSQRIQNPIIRKFRTIEILQTNEKRIIADVQGDSGANVSATNDK